MSWQKDVKKKIADLEAYTDELEKMYSDARNELASIACGHSLSGQPQIWSDYEKLKDRAAKFLSRGCRPSVKRPMWIWS